MRTLTLAAVVLGSLSPVVARAQPREQTVDAPKLVWVLPQVFGSQGLLVDSQTHRAHFNASAEAGFEPINMALASQLGAVQGSTPVTAAGYGFSSNGLFRFSSQRFGVILSERPEVIGRGNLALGFSVQHADFGSLDGIPLRRVETVFTHDGFERGGIRTDVVTSVNRIGARQTQYVGLVTYGLRERIDLSLIVPLVTTELEAVSEATLQRLGSTDPSTHFFEEETDPLGTRRVYRSRGRATGIGDLALRAKGIVHRDDSSNLALGVDVRLPTGDEENLLGTGAVAIRPFVSWSMTRAKVSPHAKASYQWNGSSVLGGSVITGEKGQLSDEVSYGVGAAVAITPRSNITVDLIGRHLLDTLRLTREEFVAATGDRFPTIGFRTGLLQSMHLALGFAMSTYGELEAYGGVMVKLNDSGLRDTVVPMGGLRYGF